MKASQFAEDLIQKEYHKLSPWTFRKDRLAVNRANKLVIQKIELLEATQKYLEYLLQKM